MKKFFSAFAIVAALLAFTAQAQAFDLSKLSGLEVNGGVTYARPTGYPSIVPFFSEGGDPSSQTNWSPSVGVDYRTKNLLNVKNIGIAGMVGAQYLGQFTSAASVSYQDEGTLSFNTNNTEDAGSVYLAAVPNINIKGFNVYALAGPAVVWTKADNSNSANFNGSVASFSCFSSGQAGPHFAGIFGAGIQKGHWGGRIADFVVPARSGYAFNYDFVTTSVVYSF